MCVHSRTVGGFEKGSQGFNNLVTLVPVDKRCEFTFVSCYTVEVDSIGSIGDKDVKLMGVIK